MQNYREINAQDYVNASRTTINETFQTLQSNNAGTEFPTSNLFVGMKCYRTDLQKTFTLVDVANQEWIDDGFVSKLMQAVTIALSEGATGTPTAFDGSGNITIPVTSLDATKLTGTAAIDITGNAASATTATSATKATKDSANQQINTTYVKGISISGRTVTITKGDGTTSTQTTQDNNTTYSAFVKSGSSAAAGLVPKPSTTAGTTKYLREDGTWQVPPDHTYSTFVKSGSSAAAGLVPKPSTTAGTTKYLREDGTWQVPPNTTYGAVTSSANGLMTPAMLAKLGTGGGITAASLAANGYVKFANGFIVQWGYISIESSDQSKSVTFPIAFSSTCYGVNLQSGNTSNTSNDGNNGNVVTSYNKSSFSINRYESPGYAFWFAYGK